jgi:dihydroorotate dehydrogenase electron transfer subunit
MIRSLPIVKKTWFNKNTFGLEFSLSGINPLPGQFFQIRVNDSMDPFLNRPISIASYSGNRLLLIIKVVGKGTRILSTRREREQITLLGPFGKGIVPKRHKSILLAGGIGVAPLYFLAQTLYKRKIPFTFLYGTKTYDELILKTSIKHMANRSIFVTEQGGSRRGTVVSAVKDMDLSDYVIAYACGPREMLIALQQLHPSVPVYAFCEDFLGCGCGLCLGCAIMYNGEYKRICEDGPVFELERIAFER